MSARSLASIRAERNRERRYAAEDALERRTYRTRNEYGEARQMVDWTREQIAKWERETECKRQAIKSREGASSAPILTPAKSTQAASSRMNWRVMIPLLLVFVLAIGSVLAIAVVKGN
jgi:CRP-like cAMP-binding protein